MGQDEEKMQGVTWDQVGEIQGCTLTEHSQGCLGLPRGRGTAMPTNAQDAKEADCHQAGAEAGFPDTQRGRKTCGDLSHNDRSQLKGSVTGRVTNKHWQMQKMQQTSYRLQARNAWGTLNWLESRSWTCERG